MLQLLLSELSNIYMELSVYASQSCKNGPGDPFGKQSAACQNEQRLVSTIVKLQECVAEEKFEYEMPSRSSRKAYDLIQPVCLAYAERPYS